MSSTKKSKTNSSKSISIDVQSKLAEFYKVAKERLLAVKNDLETSKKEYLAQKEINRKKYEFPFDVICITFWPLWILINLIINAFYDD